MNTRLLPAVYLILVLALCGTLAGLPLLPGQDIWVHAAVGRWIWEHGQVPHQTLFLWMAPIPWVAHSWLSELTFFALLTAGGEALVRLFGVVMVGLTFFLLWRLWARHAPISVLTAFVFLLAVTGSTHRYSPRAELFTSLGLTCLLLFLLRWTERGTPSPLSPAGRGEKEPPAAPRSWWDKLAPAALVLMFVIWTNAHGAVAVGLAILAATIACDLLQDRFDRRSRLLALLGLACASATLVNPYGLSYWQALRSIGGPMFSQLQEWRPFWADTPEKLDVLLPLALLTTLALFAWSRGPRRWSQLAWVLGGLAAFLSARRHSWSLSIIDLAVLGANAGSLEWKQLKPTILKKTAETDEPKLPLLSALRLVRASHGYSLVADATLRAAPVVPGTQGSRTAPRAPGPGRAGQSGRAAAVQRL